MYGYGETEALQMTFAALMPEDCHGEIDEIFGRLKNGKTIKSLKSKRVTKNGEILNIWLTATALKDESGKPVEMAFTERDLAWLSQTDRSPK